MKHETRNTVSVSKWCNKCRRMTQHQVSDRRVGGCLECGKEPEKYVPAGVVELDRPCVCPLYPFPHLHEPKRANWRK